MIYDDAEKSVAQPEPVVNIDEFRRTIEGLKAKIEYLTVENEKIRAMHSDSSELVYRLGEEKNALLMTIRVLMARVEF